MKILILGGSGMLGHRLWYHLGKEHETWITVRGSGSEIPDKPEFPNHFVRPMVDALNFDQVTRALASIEPDLVINCIGLIKQHGHLAKDPLFALSLNAMLPHKISMICKVAKIRLIHISTDCVFSGKKGGYLETDNSDAEDLYGKTKFLGEVHYPHCVTLRTSIIGHELKNKLGLVEWFLAQQGSVKGYKKAIFSGFTTDELSRIISDYVIPNKNLSGLYQVSSEPINKFDLLTLAKKYYKKDISIIPDEQVEIDRSLNSERFRNLANYQPPNWASMIEEMASYSNFYKDI